jgi:hypothetical protein
MFVSLLIKKYLNMKLSLTLISAFVVVALNYNPFTVSTTAEATKIAILEFDQKVLDYGTIFQHTDGEREFTFTNKGDAPLVITNVKSSCGCTVANFTKDPIPPGEKGKIDVVYDTKRLGVFRKSIRVYSNAKEATKLFTVQGNVVAKE